ncbi:MAG: selenium cofactor biosynthesis protein YqeC [Actinomycetota bacterium]
MLTWNALPDALGLEGREVVSFVGGGGKTTALFALGAHRAGRCVITTTTKMGADRTGGLPVLMDPSDDALGRVLDTSGSVIVWSGSDGQRAFGVEPAAIARWAPLAETIAVEADGSRRRPFKAPRDYEPVVPSNTTTLVGCVGMAAVGAPIDVGCHRPDRVAALVGASESDLLTPDRLVRVLLDDAGSRKDCPADARFAVLINRVRPEHRAMIDEIRERIASIDPAVAVVAMAEADPAALPDAG